MAWQLAKAQSQLDQDVTVLGICKRERYSVYEEAIKLYSDNMGVKFHCVITNNDFFSEFLTPALLSEFKNLVPFDIVHIHGVWEMALYRIANLCKKMGIPYIICAHGMLDIWSLKQKWLKKKIALKLLYEKMLLNAVALHALNKYEENILKKYKYIDNIFILHNGIDTNLCLSDKENCSISLHYPELSNKQFVLFMGRIHYKKGIDLLADAWIIIAKKKPHIRLLLIGTRADNSIINFWRKIKSADLEKSVLEVGPVYSKLKYELLRQCSCFVLPSRQEGFSIAVLEALCCGAPVVISDECHFKEVKTEGMGIICDLVPEYIAEGISHYLDNPSLHKDVREKRRTYVEKNHNWQDIANKSISIYSDILFAHP